MVFCVYLAFNFHWAEAAFDCSTFLSRVYEAFFNSEAVNRVSLLKKVSSMFALTP